MVLIMLSNIICRVPVFKCNHIVRPTIAFFPGAIYRIYLKKQPIVRPTRVLRQYVYLGGMCEGEALHDTGTLKWV